LNIADYEYQKAKQHRNLYNVIQEELNAAHPTVGQIQAERSKTAPYYVVQPPHPKYLILNEIPDHMQPQSSKASLQDSSDINALNSDRVSQLME